MADSSLKFLVSGLSQSGRPAFINLQQVRTVVLQEDGTLRLTLATDHLVSVLDAKTINQVLDIVAEASVNDVAGKSATELIEALRAAGKLRLPPE